MAQSRGNLPADARPSRHIPQMPGQKNQYASSFQKYEPYLHLWQPLFAPFSPLAYYNSFNILLTTRKQNRFDPKILKRIFRVTCKNLIVTHIPYKLNSAVPTLIKSLCFQLRFCNPNFINISTISSTVIIALFSTHLLLLKLRSHGFGFLHLYHLS